MVSFLQGVIPFAIANSHTIKLIRYYKGLDGLKTGFTDNAGYCLTAIAKRNNMRLISVVMGKCR